MDVEQVIELTNMNLSASLADSIMFLFLSHAPLNVFSKLEIMSVNKPKQPVCWFLYVRLVMNNLCSDD